MQTATEMIFIPWLSGRMKSILNHHNGSNMNLAQIDKAFRDMIAERGIHKKLGVTSEWVRKIRYNLANNIPISLETKLDLLKKSGWSDDGRTFSRQEVVSILNYWKKTSQAARDQGPEHVIENWERKK